MISILDGLIALHQAKLALGSIIVLQDLCGFVVDLQTLTNRFRCIVLTDHNRFTAVITDAFLLRRIDCYVIGGAALGADSPTGHTTFDHSIINLNGNHMVDLHALCIQSLRLGQGAGHPVQDKAIFLYRLPSEAIC